MDVQSPWQQASVTIPNGQSASALTTIWYGQAVRLLVPPGTQGGWLRVLLAPEAGGGLNPLIDVNGNVATWPFGPGGWIDTPRGTFPILRNFALETVADRTGATPQAQSGDRQLTLLYVAGPQYGAQWGP